MRSLAEKAVQVRLTSPPAFLSRSKEERFMPLDKGIEVYFQARGWRKKEQLAVPEPQTPMSEILPPPEKKFSQEVISLSSNLLKEKITLKPRRYVLQEKGTTPFSDVGIQLSRPKKGKKFIPPEKVKEGVTWKEGEREPIASLPSPSTLSPPSLALPGEKVSPYAFWDNLLNIKFFTWFPPGERGYWKLEVSLKPGVKVTPLPREVVFLLDASKSISEEKWAAFVKAVKSALSLLNPRDTFNVVVFRERSFPFSQNSLPATRRRIKEAENFLRDFSPQGETDIYHALSPYLYSSKNRVREIFLFTDGRPTVGITSTRELLSRINGEASNVSLFTFGVGQRVNLWILDLMANRLRGTSFYRSYENRFVQDFPAFFNMYKTPVLTDITYRFSGASEIYPVYPPNLYRKGRLILLGRVDPGAKEIVFRLRGKTGKGKKEVVYRYSLASPGKADRNLGETWARFRIHDLLVKMIIQGRRDYAGEIAALMEKYGIRLPYLEELWKKE